ncbi:transporter substrate-binding domain-containing protein [Brucella intermedia]|uniref:transporter substrate-binding domain-containing protein n=1 Tax=Brucella intermedia TaxID=94625 RepID=UPI00224A5D9F|nr:transporter substrate-binding domain-containing protein [Brucella intermedia]
MRLYRFLISSAVLFLSTFSIAAAEEALDTVKKAGKLRIGMDVAVAPYAFKDKEFKETGSDIDVARKIALDLGVNPDIVALNSANRVPYLLTNKVDIVISTLAVTDERKKVIDFTRPYSAGLNIVSAPKSLEISSFDDLKGKRVATTGGTTYDKKLTEGAPSSAQVVRFPDESTTMAALTSGQLDIVAQSKSILPVLQKQAPDRDFEMKFVLEEVVFAIGVRKDSPEMKAWLNNWVSENAKSGFLNETYRKYHELDLPQSILKQASGE